MLPHLIKNDPIKKKSWRDTDKSPPQTFLMGCPSCGCSNTIKTKLAGAAISCPWCHHIFTPAHAQSRFKSLAWNNDDAFQDWDGI